MCFSSAAIAIRKKSRVEKGVSDGLYDCQRQNEVFCFLAVESLGYSAPTLWSFLRHDSSVQWFMNWAWRSNRNFGVWWNGELLCGSTTVSGIARPMVCQWLRAFTIFGRRSFFYYPVSGSCHSSSRLMIVNGFRQQPTPTSLACLELSLSVEPWSDPDPLRISGPSLRACWC